MLPGLASLRESERERAVVENVMKSLVVTVAKTGRSISACIEERRAVDIRA